MAHGMGLGKTLTAIAWASIRREHGAILVLAKAVLIRSVWPEQLTQHLPGARIFAVQTGSLEPAELQAAALSHDIILCSTTKVPRFPEHLPPLSLFYGSEHCATAPVSSQQTPCQYAEKSILVSVFGFIQNGPLRTSWKKIRSRKYNEPI